MEDEDTAQGPQLGDLGGEGPARLGLGQGFGSPQIRRWAWGRLSPRWARSLGE